MNPNDTEREKKRVAYMMASTAAILANPDTSMKEPDTIESLRAERDRYKAACEQALAGLDNQYGVRVVDVNFPLLRKALSRTSKEGK